MNITENILEIKNLSKQFTGVKALDEVSFNIKKGEVRALSGENGAGKSTIIKILTGVYSHEEGEIVFDGAPVKFISTAEAQQSGIRSVYQELNLIPYLSVAENLFLGDYPMTKCGIDWKKLYEEASRLFQRLEINIDPHIELYKLGAAAQQMVSIAIALRKDCKLLIMDEPTSSLDKNEVEMIFSIIKNLKKQGVSMIFVTHRMEEIYQICDSITVLKDGKCLGTFDAKDLNRHQLVSLMVGREINEDAKSDRTYNIDRENETPILELRNVKSMPRVVDISLKLYRGEILGIAGLLGSGRSETTQAIYGLRRIESGEVFLHGKKTVINSPVKAVMKKISCCTENRRVDGIIPNMSVKNNLIISNMRAITKMGVIDNRKISDLVNQYIEKFSIKTPSAEQRIKLLSGGNQQKVLLARSLATIPDVLILDEPTRGIDVGAKQEIMKLIREVADLGISVIFISSDISEIVRLCDRVTVFREGVTIGNLAGTDISQDNIMQMIANTPHQNVEVAG